MTCCRLWSLGDHRQHTEMHYVGCAKSKQMEPDKLQKPIRRGLHEIANHCPELLHYDPQNTNQILAKPKGITFIQVLTHDSNVPCFFLETLYCSALW